MGKIYTTSISNQRPNAIASIRRGVKYGFENRRGDTCTACSVVLTIGNFEVTGSLTDPYSGCYDWICPSLLVMLQQQFTYSEIEEIMDDAWNLEESGWTLFIFRSRE